MNVRLRRRNAEQALGKSDGQLVAAKCLQEKDVDGPSDRPKFARGSVSIPAANSSRPGPYRFPARVGARVKFTNLANGERA